MSTSDPATTFAGSHNGRRNNGLTYITSKPHEPLQLEVQQEEWKGAQ